jgi:hypothetical protein
MSQSPRNVLGSEDRRDGKHDGKHKVPNDGHGEYGSTGAKRQHPCEENEEREC